MGNKQNGNGEITKEMFITLTEYCCHVTNGYYDPSDQKKFNKTIDCIFKVAEDLLGNKILRKGLNKIEMYCDYIAPAVKKELGYGDSYLEMKL